MRSETVSETPKCPYCGGEMVYQFDSSLMTNKEKIIYRGYFCCPNCHSRAPVVSELSELETIEEVEDEAHLMAMERIEQENRVLTLEEARNAEVDTFGTAMHWLELKIHPYKCEGEEIRHAVLAVSIFFENESEDGEADVMYSCTGEPSAWLFQKEYGKRWRCWLRKPTKEEMEGTPWEA